MTAHPTPGFDANVTMQTLVHHERCEASVRYGTKLSLVLCHIQGLIDIGGMADQGPSIIPPFTKPVWPIRDHASCVQWPFANGCTSAPMLGRSKLMWSARRAFQFDSSNSVVLCSMALYKRVHKCLPRALAPVGLPLLFPCWASPARNSGKVLCKCGSARPRISITSLVLKPWKHARKRPTISHCFWFLCFHSNLTPMLTLSRSPSCPKMSMQKHSDILHPSLPTRLNRLS